MKIDKYEVIAEGNGFWVIKDTMVNAFLLVGEERAALIDSGVGTGDMAAVVRELTDKPVMLINTHADDDHTGCNGQFERAYMHPAEFAYYHAGKPGAPVGALRDGQTLQLGWRELEIVLTPGHTQGSIAVLDRGARTLISGDGICEGPIFMFGAMRDFDAYMDSMERLAAMSGEFDAIYPSHGDGPLKPEIIGRLKDAASLMKAGSLEPIDPPFELPAKMYMHGGVGFFY